MPLQLRRGNAAELAAITPVEGELIYVRPASVSELPKLYIGDGTTAGGILVAGFDELDAKDAFAASIAAGTQTGIVFNYNNTTKAMDVTVDLTDYNGVLKATAFSGSLVSDTSNVLIDAVDGVIFGEFIQGTITADFKGDLFASDDTKMFDAATKTFTATSFEGNIITSNIGTADSSAVNFNTPVAFRTNVTIDDNLTTNSVVTHVSENMANQTVFSVDNYLTASGASNVSFRKARGSAASPVVVEPADQIGALFFGGYDGSTFIPGAGITAFVSGSVSSGTVPTTTRFLVQGSGGTIPGSREVFDIGDDGRLVQYTVSETTDSLTLRSYHTSTSDASNLRLHRSRGGITAPAAIQNGDPIYDIVMSGYDGAATRDAVIIRAVVDGTVSSKVPGKLEFHLTNNGGTTASRMNLKNDGTLEVDTVSGNAAGYITLADMPLLPTYANEANAVAAAGGTPINGMMFYDTLTSKIKAYAGGSWVALH